jgi:hypothetical protein
MASNNFPTDSELKKYISDHLGYFTSAVRNAVGELDDTYFNNVRSRKKGWKIIVSSFFVFFFSFPFIKPFPWLGFTILILSIGCFIWGVKMVRVGDGKKIREVIRKAHLALLPIIAAAAEVKSIFEVKQRKKNKKDFDTAYSKPDENMFQRNDRLAKASFQISTTHDYDELVQKLERSALLAEMQDKIRVLLMLPIIYRHLC